MVQGDPEIGKIISENNKSKKKAAATTTLTKMPLEAKPFIKNPQDFEFVGSDVESEPEIFLSDTENEDEGKDEAMEVDSDEEDDNTTTTTTATSIDDEDEGNDDDLVGKKRVKILITIFLHTYLVHSHYFT